MNRTAVLVLAAVVLGGIVGGAYLLGNRDSTPGSTKGLNTVTTPAGGAKPLCPDPVGQPTGDVVKLHATMQECVDKAGNSGYAQLSYDCTDGRTLHWDASGWGWSDGVWQAYAPGETQPPDDETTGCLG